MTVPVDARKTRLTTELGEAELKLDALSRSRDHGLMRSQQTIAGARARVLGLRAELAQIEMEALKGKDEAAIARRTELREERTSLLMRLKDAELSARAASKQATEDDLPNLIERLNSSDVLTSEIESLH